MAAWSKSVSKGVNFNALLPTEFDRIDHISTALDHCVEVRIYKDDELNAA